MSDGPLTIDGAKGLLLAAASADTGGAAAAEPERKDAPAAAAGSTAGAETKSDTTNTTETEPVVENPPADGRGAQDTPASGDQGGTTDDGSDQGALPPIAPPPSWKAEEKAEWDALPRKVQETLLRREQDNTAALRTLQNTAADQRKVVDGEVARLKGLAEQVNGVVQERVNDLAREFPEIKTQADVEALAASNPARFGLFQARLMRFNQALATQREAQAALTVQQQAAQNEALGKAKDALLTAFPTWADHTVARREMTELQDYAIGAGIPEFDARNALHPSVYKLVQKAKAYDDAQAAKTAAVKREPPKTVTPGTGNGTSKVERQAGVRQAQLAKLTKTGDIDDALGLLRG